MKTKILLIEDDPTAIAIYEKVLQQAGFYVETATTGEEGMERLLEIKEGRKEMPDLVILDLILPDMNGIKIFEKARQEQATKDIPFFILTNYISQEMKKIGDEFKVEKYIVKTNTTPSEVVKVAKEYLKQNGKNA